MVDAGGLQCAWFLANAFDTGEVGDTVPLASLQRPSPSFGVEAFAGLGEACRDRELVAAVHGRCVSAKNTWPAAHALFATNHQSSARAWQFVEKANMQYRKAGQMHAFPPEASPPVFPAIYSPTGAVPKTLRDGTVDPHNVRPTADYSWPPPGYWMRWLCPSVNETVDLEQDFPEAKCVSHGDLVEQILKLKAWGEPVV